MAPQEVEDLIARTARKVGEEVAEQVRLQLGAIGLNIESPDEQRADFDHLRRWRKNVEYFGQASVSAFLMAGAGTVLTALYYGFKHVWSDG